MYVPLSTYVIHCLTYRATAVSVHTCASTYHIATSDSSDQLYTLPYPQLKFLVKDEG